MTDATTRKILVADDNRDSADSLAMVLNMRGHDVSVVYDGEAAVSTYEGIQPDVAILDIGMPKLDGYEVAARIRRTTSGRPVTLIALTGWGQDSDKKRTMEAGFDHHLTKPVDLEELVALLRDPG
jgi:DNA-binding response OmpR family regulator